MTEKFNWVDNPTESGVASCDTDVLNDCLMHLKYNHKPVIGSTRNVGDIFYTLRLDEQLNGAYPCNGGEFSDTDFSGAQNPYELLVLGRIPSLSYEEYENQLAANNGNCGYFALDTENKKFKVPTLHEISIEATKIDNEVAKYIQDQIVNITGYADLSFRNNTRVGIVGWGGSMKPFGTYGVDWSGADGSANFNSGVSFDASRQVKTGDRVKPRTISLRFMVQLASAAEDVSIENYTKRIEDATNLSLSSINNASECLRYNSITNCILEAPNGVGEVSGKTITLKQGLKVLIPAGRNLDGTLNNTHYTLENDVSFNADTASSIKKWVLFLKGDGTIETIADYMYFKDSYPTANTSNNYVVYDSVQNKFFENKKTTVYSEKTSGAFLGYYSTNTTQIQSYNFSKPFAAAQKEDFTNDWVVKKWIFLSSHNFGKGSLVFDFSNYLPDTHNLYEVSVASYTIMPYNCYFVLTYTGQILTLACGGSHPTGGYQISTSTSVCFRKKLQVNNSIDNNGTVNVTLCAQGYRRVN